VAALVAVLVMKILRPEAELQRRTIVW